MVLTKFDSDTRGGAALSVKQITGKPIKYIGVGEKMDAVEEFYPDRIASRILGMGDVISLVEKAQEQVNEEEALAFLCLGFASACSRCSRGEKVTLYYEDGGRKAEGYMNSVGKHSRNLPLGAEQVRSPPLSIIFVDHDVRIPLRPHVPTFVAEQATVRFTIESTIEFFSPALNINDLYAWTGKSVRLHCTCEEAGGVIEA